MNLTTQHYIVIAVGVILAVIITTILIRILLKNNALKKENNFQLCQEGEKYFYEICKPHLRTLSPGERFPNKYLLVKIKGNFLDIQIIRMVRVREKLGHQKKCRRVTSQLIFAWYCSDHIKSHVYQDNLSVAKTNYDQQGFIYLLRYFIDKENVFDAQSLAQSK
jgi:hypothetical protein